MKWLKRFIILLILAAVIAAGIYYFTRPKAIEVRVKEVTKGSIEATVVNTRAGTVKACRRARLSPAIGGQIAKWPVTEGKKVKKGDLLLALWNDDLEALLKLARSEAEAAKSNAEAICLQADIAKRNANRYLALQSTGAAAEEQLDTRVTEAQARKADCTAAKTSVQVSQNRITVAKANLGRTLLFAPFDGTIADLNGELGEYVTPSPLGIQTLPPVDLVDTSCFYVSAPIDEVDVSAIRQGMTAHITLDAFRNRVFSGSVDRIADYVLDLEKQARTVEIEVLFTDPSDTPALLPGYSADAEVIIEVKEKVLRIPTEAIIEKNKVYVFQQVEQMLLKKSISVGLSNWDYSEVLSGLNEGDLVVVTVDRKGVEDGALAKALVSDE